jgi:ketosteroid isomerase-like protein
MPLKIASTSAQPTPTRISRGDIDSATALLQPDTTFLLTDYDLPAAKLRREWSFKRTFDRLKHRNVRLNAP